MGLTRSSGHPEYGPMPQKGRSGGTGCRLFRCSGPAEVSARQPLGPSQPLGRANQQAPDEGSMYDPENSEMQHGDLQLASRAPFRWGGLLSLAAVVAAHPGWLPGFLAGV